MNKIEAIEKLRNTIRRKHFSLSTERTYIGWLVPFIRYLADGHGQGLSSKAKVEAFLTQLAHQGVSSSTQNQAFNALLFFYKDCLDQPLEDISALRARRPARLRIAPSVEQTQQLLAACQDIYGY